MVLLKEENNKTIVNIGPIPSVMDKVPVIFDSRARINLIREKKLTPFLKTQFVHGSKMTRLHEATYIPLRITSSNKLYVHVGRMMELINYLVCQRLAAPALPRSDF